MSSPFRTNGVGCCCTACTTFCFIAQSNCFGLPTIPATFTLTNSLGVVVDSGTAVETNVPILTAPYYETLYKWCPAIPAFGTYHVDVTAPGFFPTSGTAFIDAFTCRGGGFDIIMAPSGDVTVTWNLLTCFCIDLGMDEPCGPFTVSISGGGTSGSVTGTGSVSMTLPQSTVFPYGTMPTSFTISVPDPGCTFTEAMLPFSPCSTAVYNLSLICSGC